jgi:hypothetical protein
MVPIVLQKYTKKERHLKYPALAATTRRISKWTRRVLQRETAPNFSALSSGKRSHHHDGIFSLNMTPNGEISLVLNTKT